MDRAYTILDLVYEFNGMIQHLYPVVLFGKEDVVLVDCGYPGSLSMIEEELNRHNIEPNSLTKLVLTHQDDDHIGSASELKRKYPQIEILSSKMEAPYISQTLKNLRLEQAERLQELLPNDQKEFGEQFCDRYRNLEPVDIDTYLYDGDEFDWAGGCKIVMTPGHTPGHISLYLTDLKHVITGDAAVLEENQLKIANPEFCLDMDKAKESLQNLLQLDCDCYVCYHGGVLQNKQSINEFTINEMMNMQRTLQDKYKDKWEGISEEVGKNKLLWMIGEIGEVIDIVKKHGGVKASHDNDLRKELIEELADVLMYYNDVLLCYGISSDELKSVYIEKFLKNMKRW